MVRGVFYFGPFTSSHMADGTMRGGFKATLRPLFSQIEKKISKAKGVESLIHQTFIVQHQNHRILHFLSCLQLVILKLSPLSLDYHPKVPRLSVCNPKVRTNDRVDVQIRGILGAAALLATARCW